ncbi:Uncharacterised protein [Mycoplasmopsis bovigenitalium]|uniref:DUF1410 domain-containing protein n=1 Tax=Mycoplasmopsis bovigenitalium TaxID=2112 RepID=A0A449A9C2_9BACT|nr:DUF1410 domain-containing protein [Mycoplasmopsis bovigenitalium]VEU60875.1 Uncharacterised protein [Mycoplasmopsis bovigenitalium]
MAKTKIILASTLSVLAVASVTTAAVVVTQKKKKQSDTPKKGNEVVVAVDSKFEYGLNTEQTKVLSAKLLLVKGQDVTVTLTENNSSKTIKTKVKEDGTIDFSNLKDGKTYTVTKIVVKEGDNERDLIAEVKAPKEKPGNDAQPGGTAKPIDPTNGDNKKPGDAAKPTEPNQGDDPSANAGADAGKGPETGGTGAGKDKKEPETSTPGKDQKEPGTTAPDKDKKEPETSTPGKDQKEPETSTPETDQKEPGTTAPETDQKEPEASTPQPEQPVQKHNLVVAKSEWEGEDNDKWGYLTYTFNATNQMYETLKKATKIEIVLDSTPYDDIKSDVSNWGKPNGSPIYLANPKPIENGMSFQISPTYYLSKKRGTVPPHVNKFKVFVKALYINGDNTKNLLDKVSEPIELDFTKKAQ